MELDAKFDELSDRIESNLATDSTTLEADLDASVELDVTFKSIAAEIESNPDTGSATLKANLGEVTVVHKIPSGKVYEGDYTVTPKLEEQTLPTKDKVLTEDIQVEKIPITKTANSSGGNTVIIGG